MNAFKPAFRSAIRPAITSVFGVQVPVVTPLTFVSQPQSKTVDEYALATFSCEVTGGVAPYSYQYKKNGANVGTNSAALSFTAAAADKNASVVVTVTDSAGTSITSTAAVLGVISYAFNFDGLTQYAPLSTQFPLLVGDLLSVRFRAPLVAQTDYKTMIARHANYGGLIQFGNTNTWSFSKGTLKVDGADVTSSTILPNDGLIHSAELTLTSTSEISAIGCQWSTLGSAAFRFFDKDLYDIKVVRSGVTVFKLSMDNKPAGALQPSSSSITAAIVNYNESGWVAV